MIEKNSPKELISAEEVALVCKRAGTLDSIYRAIDIEKEVWKLNEHEKDLLWLRRKILAAIYDGGRMQGIREERARQKAKKAK